MGECILGNFTLNSINPLSTDAFVARIIDDGASASFKSSQMHPVQQAKTDANHEINLYPNPNNGIFTLQISKGFEEIKEICVYTIVGNMVKQIQQSLTGNSSVNLDLRDLPNGIYLIKVKTNNNSWTKKVILN
jgi:hypothetical protein